MNGDRARLHDDHLIAPFLFNRRRHGYRNTARRQRLGEHDDQSLSTADTAAVMPGPGESRRKITNEEDRRRMIAAHTLRSSR
jgi:hypothetical protein